MKSQDYKVEEDRAASLLGLTAAELRRLSKETGLGHIESQGGSNRLFFTYAELYRLCLPAAQFAAF